MQVKLGYKSINGDYIFAKTAKMVSEYKQKYPNCKVIDLGVGDVKRPPVKSINKALISESKRFTTSKYFCGYPNECGIFELRKKISEYYREYNAEVLPEEVFITTGAKPAISQIMQIARFTRALIPIPTYPLYQELCDLHCVKKVLYKKPYLSQNGGQKCDLIFICSPNNPTGEILDNRAIDHLLAYLNANNSIAVIDGAYSEFNTNYLCPYSFSGSKNVIEVRSYSKSLSFTGLRCGYMIIKKQNPLYKAYERYLSTHSNGVNVVMQRVAMAYYQKSAREELVRRINYYRKNAKIARSILDELNLEITDGQNAPYLWLKVKQNGLEFCKELLYKKGVVVTAGEGFGASDWVRISCLAPRKDIIEGANLIKDYLLGC